jgi:predicted nuclease of predicted toxin-antitoxin system
VRWLADENIQRPLVHELRGAGHDVIYAAEFAPQTEDVSLADMAIADGRILLTEDKDFGEIAFKDRHDVPGIVLLRFADPSWEPKWRRLLELIAAEADALCRRFTVLEETRVRTHPLRGA